jgi:hypothetical protein
MSIKPKIILGEELYIPTCDFCGAELTPEPSEYAAELAIDHANWQTKQENGEFKDYCPVCQERMKKS